MLASLLDSILETKDHDSFKRLLVESQCRNCALHENRTNIVVYRGNPQAKILILGEAPGENEDRSGQPFVGRAGKTFDSVMYSIGIDSNRDLFICNVVKCRPPKNRRPKLEEAQACRPFLMHQIQLVSPKIVVLLGATALKHIAPDKKNISMNDEVGKFFDVPSFPGIKFITFYHPAALLYNSKLKIPMSQHAQILKTWIDKNIFE